jgi:hypothetical protein
MSCPSLPGQTKGLAWTCSRRYVLRNGGRLLRRNGRMRDTRIRGGRGLLSLLLFLAVAMGVNEVAAIGGMRGGMAGLYTTPRCTSKIMYLVRTKSSPPFPLGSSATAVVRRGSLNKLSPLFSSRRGVLALFSITILHYHFSIGILKTSAKPTNAPGVWAQSAGL